MAKRKIAAAAKEKPIIAMQVPVTITASESGESQGPPKFSVTAYTGGALNIAGWDMPVVIDLAGLQFARSIVANLDHNSSQRVGHVTEKSKSDSQLDLEGVFSAATTYRDEVVNSAADGFQWEASVEVSPSKVVEVEAGKTVKVNGQELTGPLYVTRKGTLSGFGFVSHGADPNTSVSIAAQAASQKEQNMKAEVKAWVESLGLVADDLTDEQVANLTADYEGRDGIRANTPKVEAGGVFEKSKNEAKRRADIRDIADKHISARRCEERGDQDEIDTIRAMHDEAIETKMSSQEFRLKLYEASIPMAQTVYSPADKASAKISGKVIEAAICMQGNMSAEKLDAAYGDEIQQAAHDRFKAGIGIREVWSIFAKQNGYRQDGYNVTAEMQEYAFRKPAAHIKASGGYSTYDLASVLANTANKFLLEGWGAGEMAWSGVTDVVSVRDFKEATFFKLSGDLKYKKVAPGGQLEHGQISTGSYTAQAETYGILFGIDRTAIINDDLSVITRVPLEMGYGANDAFNEVFWTEFLDNGSFFTGGNGNTSSGVLTGATGIATLTAAEAAFTNQTKPNGRPLGIMPTTMLVPPLAKRSALALVSSSLVVGSTGPTPDANTFQGEYKVLCSAYIANSAFSGYSTVKWYLLCNRPGFSTMLTAFLNGRQAPTVETADMVFNTLGVQMRGYHDFGTSKMEYRAGVQGSGA